MASRAGRVHGRRGVAVRRHRRRHRLPLDAARAPRRCSSARRCSSTRAPPGIRYPISGMWGGANDDLDGLQAWLTELRDIGYFGMMLGNARARRDRERRVHADRRGGRVLAGPRPARDARPSASDEQVIYGDANQGEGHEIHIAHVATARKLLTWARELGVGMTTNAAADPGRALASDHRRRRSLRRARAAPRTRRCSPTSRRWAAARCATATRATPGSPTRRPCSPATAARAGAGWNAMPSWWGWATENTLDRATAHLPGAALRTPRRDRHRLHDPLSVDDARVPRGRRRRAHRPALPRREPRARQPVRAVPRSHHRRRAGPDARSEARDRRARVRGARARLQDRGVRRSRAPPDRRRRRATGSTRSASTARSTTTRCGPSASSSASRRCSTARCRAHRVTRSATSYVYNHIGGLAASHESLCKSLFLSGVTHRFPTLRFGFLEGGVAWACSLLGDLVGHWEKRNARDDPLARSRSPRRRRAARALRALRRRPRARRPRRAARVLHPPERAPRAARRVRGGRARLGRRHPRPLRAELLLRLRGRRPARRLGVRRARQPGRRAAAPDLRLRHLALGRARHDRAGRGGVRARRGRRDRRGASSASSPSSTRRGCTRG